MDLAGDNEVPAEEDQAPILTSRCPQGTRDRLFPVLPPSTLVSLLCASLGPLLPALLPVFQSLGQHDLLPSDPCPRMQMQHLTVMGKCGGPEVVSRASFHPWGPAVYCREDPLTSLPPLASSSPVGAALSPGLAGSFKPEVLAPEIPNMYD